jgi:hypothetical protein
MLKIIRSEETRQITVVELPSDISGDSLNNVRCKPSRHFWIKKREYLKHKMKELAMNNKNKNNRDPYRGTNKIKKGYQPRSNLVKDENGDLLADSHNILNRWKNHFAQLLNCVSMLIQNGSTGCMISVHGSLLA